MAITPYGFDGDVYEGQWATLMRYMGEVSYKHGVATGFDASPGTGRTINVTGGTAVVAGVVITSDATISVPIAANTGTSTRTDLVVLAVDWTANTATVTVVQGTSSAIPAVTQDEGDLWQMPLARITVAPAASSFSAGAVVVCKPLPRTVPIVYKPAVNSFSQGPSHAQTAVSTAAVVDPGWPYRVEVSCAVAFAAAGSGWGRIILQAGSAVIVRGETTQPLSAGRSVAQATGTSDVLTGPQSITANVVDYQMGSGDGPLTNSDQTGLNHFHVKVIPA